MTQDIKVSRQKMRDDYHYIVGKKFPFYYRDVEIDVAQVNTKEVKKRTCIMNKFKRRLGSIAKLQVHVDKLNSGNFSPKK